MSSIKELVQGQDFEIVGELWVKHNYEGEYSYHGYHVAPPHPP